MVLKEYWELQLDKACSSEGKEHSDSGFIQEGEPREFSGRKMWILKEKQHWGWLKAALRMFVLKKGKDEIINDCERAKLEDRSSIWGKFEC